MRYRVAVEGRTFDISIGPGGWAWVNRQPFRVDLKGQDERSEYSLLIDHRSYEAHVEAQGDGEYRVAVAGRPYRARLVDDRQPTAQTASPHLTDRPLEITAPLPGLLVEVRVTAGQPVMEGDVLAVLESMKMHLEIRAPRSGVVYGLHAAGREVVQGEALAVIMGA